MASSLGDFATSGLTQVAAAFGDTSTTEVFSNTGKVIVDKIIEGIDANGDRVGTSLKSSAMDPAASAIENEGSTWYGKGGELTAKFAGGIGSLSSLVISAASALVRAATTMLSSSSGTASAKQAGSALGKAFASGITSQKEVAHAAGNLFDRHSCVPLVASNQGKKKC